MALPAQDTFTAASDAALQTYSANWTINSGAFTVVAATDKCRPNSTSDECGAHWNADTFAADQYAQVTLPASGTFNDAEMGPAVRCAASGATYYGLYYNTGNLGSLWLFKVVSGTWTELAYVTNVGFLQNGVLRLEVSGTTLTPKWDGTTIAAIGTKTDSSIASGYAGICGWGNQSDALLDNFEGGNLGASGVSGTAAITLGTLTASSAGTVAVKGAAAVTLGALILSAAGTVPSPGVSGTASITLGALTASSAGTVAVKGNAAVTLGTLTSSAAGTVAVKGAASITLGALTSAARGYILSGATVAGVLTVDGNGRYFRNTAGPVLLSGFHTWYEFQDGSGSYPPTAFDYAAWLDYLDTRGVNLHKLWVMESARQWADADHYFYPMPYQRTGPGNAADGRLKFDLTLYEPTYFERLRERAIQAGNRGHYVIVQLFQGWQVESKGYGYTPFAYHPYNNGNNVNSIDGDTDNDGAGEETRVTAFTAVYNLQKAYIAQVIDTLNDLDNILWEISNEDTTNSVAWQQALIDYIHTYEAGKAKQHPVGMTVIYPGGSNSDLTASNAEWISPNGDLDPEAADGSQVVIFDTDHLVGLTAEYKWAWKAFTRGHNPAYMDEYDGGLYGSDTRNSSAQERIRYNLGYILDYAARVRLTDSAPAASRASTGYCLAVTTGRYQIVAYQPDSGAFTVDLSGLAGTFALEWLRTLNGTTQAGSNVTGGAVRTLTPPWAGEDAVALLEIVGTDGAAAITLGALTASAAGTVAITGAASVTLGALTAAGVGTVAVAGAASITLGALTVASAGAVAVAGAASVTLDSLTAAGAGTVAIAGAAFITLGELQAAATGTVAVSGGADVTLGALTLAGVAVVGEVPISGAASITLDDLTASAAGTVAIAGTAAVVLGALALEASVTVAVTGAVTGAADLTLGSLTSSAAGAVAVTGAGAVTLDALTCESAGVVGEYVVAIGSASITLGALTVVSIGTVVTAIVTVWGSVTGPGATGSTVGPRANSAMGM